MMRTAATIAALAWMAAAVSPALAQVTVDVHVNGPHHVVIPQLRSFAPDAGRRGIVLEGVRAAVSIVDRAASTTLEILVRNPGGRPEEAVLLLPVPEGAAVSRFLFEGPAKEPTARVLSKAEARRVYDGIVARQRDPALLELAGYNLVRSSVFPVPANGTQRVRLTYEHLLEGDGSRIDYVLPRSESLAAAGVPWTIEASIRSKVPVSTVFSPSHEVIVDREDVCRLRVRGGADAARTPGPFLLSVLLEGDGVTASLFAYPDPRIGGGYFLLLAGLPARTPEESRTVRREVTLVLDRSGSMAGPKLEQVRAAAARVCESLRDGEAFNIIDYATSVSLFAAKPVVKDGPALEEARRYLASLRPMGGTALHDALVEALRQPVTPGCLPLVLFLTDGLPTIGPVSEAAIRESVEKGNPHRRRIFTLGVGADVNVPLLDRLADVTRGFGTNVLPGEDVGRAIDQVFRRLSGPVLTDARLEVLDAEGGVTTRAVHDLVPDKVPDLFEGDRFVLLGQYRGEGPLAFRLGGSYLGRPRTFAFRFAMDRVTTRNAFVPRLWASRRIADLVDRIRQMGGEASVPAARPHPMAAGVRPPAAGGGADPMADPRFKELTDEILRLSTEFGILTEYTAFLALEGTDFRQREALLRTSALNLDRSASATRSGLGAVSQAVNIRAQRGQSQLNPTNGYFDQNMNRVEVTSVQQMGDRAFFHRGGRWVDSRALARGEEGRVNEVVTFGSEAHRRLVERLAAEGRQGMVAQDGEVLLDVDGRNVLVK